MKEKNLIYFIDTSERHSGKCLKGEHVYGSSNAPLSSTLSVRIKLLNKRFLFNIEEQKRYFSSLENFIWPKIFL